MESIKNAKLARTVPLGRSGAYQWTPTNHVPCHPDERLTHGFVGEAMLKEEWGDFQPSYFSRMVKESRLLFERLRHITESVLLARTFYISAFWRFPRDHKYQPSVF